MNERRRYGRRLVATASGVRQIVLDAAWSRRSCSRCPAGRLPLVAARMRGRWPNG
ncbi:hypothetical protein [Plantactinospora mayteni]|uniref:hypothetical protein n=1 Tax=Plantactinospora mayteni TaxID=566021 RepID=UPI00194297B6|nr:hypothetical protein [Plantactinospora mayteni]